MKQSALADAANCILLDNWDISRLIEQTTRTHRTIGLTCASGHLPKGEDLFAACQNGLKLIVWHVSARRSKTLEHALWEAAKAGIWNHLVFASDHSGDVAELVQFALSNSNVAHSWESSDHTVCPPYAKVKPLPGKPLWVALDTHGLLLNFLHTYGIDAVQRWRLMDDKTRVEQLGRSIQYCYAKPDDLPPGHLEEIFRMVEAGGSVDMEKVKYNLERAFLIAYATEFGVIIGNSSLKHPRKAYIQSLFHHTGYDFSGYLERGYTSVRPEYRGLGVGTKLLAGLTKRVVDKKLYSIITEDNLATQKIAIRNKTRKLTTFYSEKAGKKVGLWVPE